MLEQAGGPLAQFKEASRIELRQADLLDTALEDASVVIMNYTLQFIAVQEREALLKRIREAMLPGDVLILSEKLTLPDQRLNEYLIDLHHDFKRQQGYSDLEIAQKRQALEDVLVPETRQNHVERLHKVGFSRCDVWFQCLNFGSLIAIARPAALAGSPSKLTFASCHRVAPQFGPRGFLRRRSRREDCLVTHRLDGPAPVAKRPL